MIFVVYSGAEKLDIGPKRVAAICSSAPQAAALIKGMWPGFGYYETMPGEIEQIASIATERENIHEHSRHQRRR